MTESFKYEERDETIVLSEDLKDTAEKYPFALLTAGVGSGKTYICIRAAYLIDPNAFIVMVAPLSKIKEGSWEPSVEAFNESMNSNLSIYSTNYDQLITANGPKKISNQLEQAVNAKRTIILIYDEAHIIKLSSNGALSQTAKRAIELSKLNIIDYTIGATGTPLANSYVDYGTYFIMAGFYENKTQYLNEQILRWDKYFAPDVKNKVTGKIDRNLFSDPDKIETLQNQITVFAETEHLLPSYKDHWVSFRMDDTDEFVDDQLATEYTDKEALPRTFRGHYNHVKKMVRNGGFFEFPITGINIMRRFMAKDPSRLKECARILFNKLNDKNPHPVLIFYLNNAERDTLTDFLQTNPHFKDVELRFVNGDRKDKLTPDQPRTIYLIQYKAGSAAIEIPEAKAAIFYMPTYSYADFKQAKGRNRRNLMSSRNNDQTIHYYYLTAKHTLDERIWSTVDAKKDFSNNALRIWLNSREDDS